MTFAAIFAAAMMAFSSCEDNNKPDDTNKPGNGTTENLCPDCGKDPCECPEEYASPITIDGDFSDWAALDASKVAVANCASDPKYSALTTLKVYADAVYVNVYFEFVEDEIADTEWVPFHVYLDADNSDTTGGYGDQWTDPHSEWNMEGAVMEGGAFCSYDPGLYPWEGGVGESGWLWGESVLSSGSGIGNGAGSGNKYEFSLLREMLMGVEFADSFGIGVDIQQDWSSVGVLPNANVTDDNPSGLAPLLRVTIAK